jgi:hypothetical protein
MSRPYSNDNLDKLRVLFERNKNNSSVLEKLLEELFERKRKGARSLLADVSRRLADLESDSSEQDEGYNHASAGDSPATDPQLIEFHPDDQRRPTRLTRIRPPGTAGLPDAWQPTPKTDLSLAVGQDAGLPERFVAALRALIAEIKRSGAGQKRYELETGLRLESAANEIIYVFPFTDEAELFEEAQIEVEAAGRRIDGSIVSISAGKLILSIKEDLGQTIGHAVLIIDSTALLEALADRIEQVAKGQIALNRGLADAVAGVAAVPAGPPPLQRRFVKSLNEAQLRAYERSLSDAVTWIMGPPGCGKTKTLGEIVRSAFENDQRILVCSNTNKAVDQLLYEVCKALGVEHKAMQAGKLVRLGRIADDKLRADYEPYVTVDGILDRLSRDLNERRRQVEEQIALIDADSEQARRTISEFEAFERAEQMVAEEASRANEIAKAGNQSRTALAEGKNRLLKLDAELRARQTAIFPIFKRSIGEIELDLRGCRASISEIEATVARLRIDHREAHARHEASTAERDLRWNSVASKDKAGALLHLQRGDEKRSPLVSELREIEAKIANLRASILKDARILATTCTKAYLSVKDVGQADIVILDEASMVMLPMAWFAAGLARQRVVICGDFRQLPPIVQTEQEAILSVIGPDAFKAVGIATEDDDRLVRLDLQYRMDPLICDLISGPMYRNRLATAHDRDTRECITSGALTPSPLGATLSVIDTSDLWPFESQTIFFSRFNLMHALLVRNIVWHFNEHLAVSKNSDLGICTPYAAQAKLIQKLVERERSSNLVQVGTVHRYQGDERRTILFDIPESHGGARYLGRLIQGIPPGDHGARLINVAVSRAQCRLIVVANLTYLDSKLPSTSLLRSVLFDMQRHGQVVSGTEILKLRPIESDLRGLVGQLSFDEITETLGVFDEPAFERALSHDISKAKESVVIFSGYVTPSRVSKLGDLFRSKRAEGVRIRCVTRPPNRNGSIPVKAGRDALDILEGIGVTVDCRANIHQKVCLIDNQIVWLGSLNALSHAGRSDETMTRAVSAGYAEVIAAHMSKRRVSSRKAAAAVADAENPRCPVCDSRTSYNEGRYGPYYACEDCDWKMNQKTLERTSRNSERRGPSRNDLPEEGPSCPECSSDTRLRYGRNGPFYSCTRYPACRGSVNTS